MTIISIILGILQGIPTLISAIQQIISMIHSLPLSQRRQAARDLRDAYDAAKSGDPQKLKDLHDVLCKQLPGDSRCQ